LYLNCFLCLQLRKIIMDVHASSYAEVWVELLCVVLSVWCAENPIKRFNIKIHGSVYFIAIYCLIVI
jgi:hypothetical protein